MSANIKIGGNIINDVYTMKVENADQPGQYVDFYNLTPVEQTVSPTTYAQVVTPQIGEALSSVTVEGVTAEIDSNIQAQNIKDGVTILGVVGSLASKLPQIIDKTVTTITADDLVGASKIGSYAFYSCSRLTSVTIGNDITSIGQSAFSGCSGLTSVTIGNSVTSIGERAFYDCVSLTSVTLPNSTRGISANAFSYCTSLISVTIPYGVTSIGNYAFAQCNGLTSVTIPDSVTIIGDSAFSGCSGMTTTTIGNGVKSIGASAFISCTGLTSVTLTASNPPFLRDRAFDGTNNCPIYVPAGSVDAYKSATNWSALASRIQAIPS